VNEKLLRRLENIQRLGGWCTLDKATQLADLIIEHRPNLVVEIGVFAGRSAIAMAMACQHIGNGRVVGIDPWSKEAALEGENSKENSEWWSNLDLDQIYRTCQSTVFSLGVEDYLTLMRKHDVDALELFEDGSIDLIHLDSNHSEVISVRSVRDWVPKLKPGGFFAMDDSDWATTARAIELLKEGLGTKHLFTHNMQGPPDTEGKPTHGGQWMLFEKVS
jgi:predicted O-methyltransferase YrrM